MSGGYSYVLPHVTGILVMIKVVGQELLEFIITFGIKKWIILCGSRKDILEFVVIYKTEMPCVNSMKDVQR